MAKGFYRYYGTSMGFPILPDASSLFVDLLHDPDSFKNEQHDPGIYDENGDYVPQYSDDPEFIQALVTANPDNTGVADSHPGTGEGNDTTADLSDTSESDTTS